MLWHDPHFFIYKMGQGLPPYRVDTGQVRLKHAQHTWLSSGTQPGPHPMPASRVPTHKSRPRGHVAQAEKPGQDLAREAIGREESRLPTLHSSRPNTSHGQGKQPPQQHHKERGETEACAFHKPASRGLERLGDLLQVPGISTGVPAIPGLTVDSRV